MVKDGEIVYPGTELTQSGELPPRKGMDFYFFFFFVNFFFHCDDENGIQISYCHRTFCLLLSVCTICRCSCFELNTIETDFLKAYRKVTSKPSNEGLNLFQPFEIKIHN